MYKKYIVRLSDEERSVCQEVVKKLKGSSQKARRAQILLKADAEGPGWPDAKIADEVRSDPSSPYAGKLIGIANGQIAALADSWDEVARLLRQAEPDPQKTFCFEAGEDQCAVEEIWGLR